MESKRQLQQLFRYDLWANKKIATALNNAAFEKEQCVNLFAHIGAAQDIWYERIKGNDIADIELWPVKKTVDQSLEIIRSMNVKWLKMLEKNNLDEVISYTNSKNRKFNTSLTGILHHIIIHGQHHRAQIATQLRQNDIDPPATGFIFYLRND